MSEQIHSESQKIFGNVNYEYPIKIETNQSDLLKSWGSFKPDKVNLSILGIKNSEAVKLFDVFHTIDREKIAKEFSKYQHLLKDKKFFVQINTGREKSKSGIYPEDTKDFLFFLKNEINLNIQGLMCIPPIADDPKYHFKQLQNLAKENSISKLSIGMSGDYKEALPFKPTYIRLGTILFGKRN